MKTRRVVLTESLLFFHEDQRFPQTFAEYTKKEEQKEKKKREEKKKYNLKNINI